MSLSERLSLADPVMPRDLVTRILLPLAVNIASAALPRFKPPKCWVVFIVNEVPAAPLTTTARFGLKPAASAVKVTGPAEIVSVCEPAGPVNAYAAPGPREMIGASSSVTVKDPLATLPARSVAVTPTFVAPGRNDEPLAGACTTTGDGVRLSLAVAGR